MRLYPAFLNLAGKRALVVGGGSAAARKARALLRAGARVEAVSPWFSSGFPERAARRVRAYRPKDVLGFHLVAAATDDPEADRAVAADARSAGALAEVADDPEGSDVVAPAVLRRGGLMIAVATPSGSPAVSRRIRRELGELYGEEYAGYLRLLGELRPSVMRTVPDPVQRRALLRRLASAEFARLFREEGRAAARHAMLQAVREA